MHAVPQFARGLLSDLGAPRGHVSTFTEVQVKDAAGKLHVPDGAIVVERGRTRWRCLVEVKTGAAELRDEQVARYLDWAKANDFDAVLTISNQITSSAKDTPVTVDSSQAEESRALPPLVVASADRSHRSAPAYRRLRSRSVVAAR
jgi:hypothetical protein